MRSAATSLAELGLMQITIDADTSSYAWSATLHLAAPLPHRLRRRLPGARPPPPPATRDTQPGSAHRRPRASNPSARMVGEVEALFAGVAASGETRAGGMSDGDQLPAAIAPGNNRLLASAE